uniref:Uncharacterized protein n=1 Tax=viral metagenome TaxID=1070528 RepID=A0A2V0RID3_9ZZZZ
MSIIQIPPMNHIRGSLSRVITSASKLTKSTLDRVYTGCITLTVRPSTDMIDLVISNLISFIQVSGKASEARRRLGPQWEDLVKKSVVIDFMRAYHLAQIVQDDSSFSWTTIKEAYGSMKATRMSNLLFQILSANTGGFEIPGTGYRFFYNFRLEVGINMYEKWAKSILGKEFDSLKSQNYRSAEYYGVLASVKSFIVEDFFLETPKPTLGSIEPMCLGDVLFNDSSYIDLVKSSNSKYYILHSEGVSPISMAFNIFFGTKLQEVTVLNINLVNMIYYFIEGSPKVEVLELITNVAFGISYTDGQLLSDDAQPFGGTGNGGNDGPDGNPPDGPIDDDGKGSTNEPNNDPTNSPSQDEGGSSGGEPESVTFTENQLDQPKLPESLTNKAASALESSITEVLGEVLTGEVTQLVQNQLLSTPDIKQKTLINRVVSKIPGLAGNVVQNIIPIAVSALYLSDRNRALEGSTTGTSISLGLRGPSISRTTTKTTVKPVKRSK